MSQFTLLLVEDESTVCKRFTDIIDKTDECELIGVTSNSEKAFELIKDCLPDAVILDLELHNGGGNGLTLLQILSNTQLPKVPYILVTTNNTSSRTYETARRFGADFIMSKHQENYSEQGVIDFLKMMQPVITSTRVKSSANATTETPSERDKRISRRIMSELDLIGVNTKSVGYKYLIDAIKIVMDSPSPNICGVIAKKYGKTDSSVERAVQNAINRAWNTSPLEDLQRYYTAHISSAKGVPTLTEFIHYYARKIKNEY